MSAGVPPSGSGSRPSDGAASVSTVPASIPNAMRFAYADPPYLGQGVKHYGDRHDEASDCDTVEWHAALIERLCSEFPDGWALSLHTPSLKTMLNLCPDDIRVGAWVKPFASFKPNVTRAYAWEPVIFRGGRDIPRTELTVRDFVAEPIAMMKGFPGAKPWRFCWWVFDFLGMTVEDEIDDLFPGSGSVWNALQMWREAKSGDCQFGMFGEAA